MHILYVDESGVEETNSGTTHFVLLAIAIKAEQWKRLDRALDEIKAAYDLCLVEIHTAWMSRRYAEQEAIPGVEGLSRAERRVRTETEMRRRAGVVGVRGNKRAIKNYRRECRAIGPYVHLSRTDRHDCLKALASELSKWSDLRIFADAVCKADFTTGKFTPYELAFEQVLTRYQTFLDRVDSTGIVVHDNNTKVAPRIHALSRKFHEHGTLYKAISRVIETPLFVDSAITSMIQMADLCSYALRRLIENGEPDLWDLVESRVERVNATHVGVRHYTGQRTCKCRICIAHGRT